MCFFSVVWLHIFICLQRWRGGGADIRIHISDGHSIGTYTGIPNASQAALILVPLLLLMPRRIIFWEGVVWKETHADQTNK